MTVAQFTPWSALAGGLLIGAGSAVPWWGIGRIAGVSNILGQLLSWERGHRAWRVAFLLGLFVTGLAAGVFAGDRMPFQLAGGYGRAAVAGALVGFGTQMANGCTSGHGVCGMGRLSKRSIAATLCFMLAAGVAVFLTSGS